MENTKIYLIDNQKMITKTIEEYLKTIPNIEISTNQMSLEELAKDRILISIVLSKEIGFAMMNELKNNTQKEREILHRLGMPSHLKGYQYVLEGILLVQKEKYSMRRIYQLISEKYDATISSVERAIRNAIEISWTRGDWELMEEIFGNSIDLEKGKPTNQEFLLTIVEQITKKG